MTRGQCQLAARESFYYEREIDVDIASGVQLG